MSGTCPRARWAWTWSGDLSPSTSPSRARRRSSPSSRTRRTTAKSVYLATDPDREGEAISWHLKELLDLPDDKTSRVTFNEITKKVVDREHRRPRDIDQNLVDAQQARRVLDRIVGYELSPLLWKKIRRGLSAGRVQSVATRLVAEREEEIRAFVPEEYWTAGGHPGPDRPPTRAALRPSFYGQAKRSWSSQSGSRWRTVLAAIAGRRPFRSSRIKRQDKNRSPAPPFITSTLQQEASRKLNMTPPAHHVHRPAAV